jgi:outer membrane immunogenic protein
MSWRGFAIACALCGTAGIAQAADQSVAARTQYGSSYYPTEIYWTGAYVGANLGGAYASAPWIDPHDGLADNPSTGTFIGGGQVGSNFQFDNLVWGVEADIDGMSVKSQTTDAAGDTRIFRAYWVTTETTRFGYALNTILFYVKGGFAAGSQRDTLVAPPVGSGSTGTAARIGWTVGAGVEYGLSHNWSARMEYDFIDLASDHLFVTGSVGKHLPVGVDYTLQRLVAGLNYHF